MTSGVLTVGHSYPSGLVLQNSAFLLHKFILRRRQNCPISIGEMGKMAWNGARAYARAQGGGHVHLIKGNYGTRGSSHQSPQEAFPIPTPAGLVSHSAAGNDFSPSLVCHQLLMLLSAISLSRTAMRGLFNGAYVWVNLRQ